MKYIRIIWLGLVIGLVGLLYIKPTLAQSGGGETSRLFLPLISRMSEPVWLGPESADVVSIAYDRRVEDRVYLGTWGAGVFVSEDGGIRWKRQSSGLDNLYIQRLAVDPLQAGVVYAGTYGSGIYKTNDGGWNWYPVNQGVMNGAIVYGLTVDPQQPQRVYASARVANRNEEPWGGVVYRSLDGGLTWQAVLQNIGGSNVQDWVYSLAVDPQNPQRVLAASHEHGIYRSQDYGTTWQAANSGISDLSGRAVVFDPRGRIAYLGVWHRTGEFKTLNGGDGWILQSNGLTGSKIYDLVVNPHNPEQLLAATFMMNFSDTERGVARSDNGGELWVKSGLQPYFIYTVAVNPFNGNEMLAGTVDYGVFRSTDGGKNWIARNEGLINATVTHLTFDPNLPQVWYAAVQGRGVWRSPDGGNHWQPFGEGLETTSVYSLAWEGQDSRRILALTPAGWMAADSDGEGTWEAVEPTQIAVDEMTYRSFTDWQEYQPPKPGFEFEVHPSRSVQPVLNGMSLPGNGVMSDALPVDVRIYTLLQAPLEGWLAGTSDGIYQRESGAAWQPVGLQGQTVVGLAIDPLRRDWIVAVTPSQIWLSRDAGRTWQMQDAGMPLDGIQGVWFNPQGRLLVSLVHRGLLCLDRPW
ncbi:hypothetical protein BECAL_00901 [Bellilinea caldifistulae]|nr:hypothetical protein [Bellilinea caldifistulae]GAP09750.1 hypothetical protein BECAL_00901 [Bellilinea caldifistulae]